MTDYTCLLTQRYHDSDTAFDLMKSLCIIDVNVTLKKEHFHAPCFKLLSFHFKQKTKKWGKFVNFVRTELLNLKL